MTLTAREAVLWTVLVASTAGQSVSAVLDIAAEIGRQHSTVTTPHARPIVAQGGR